jgi:hypothetical protein
MGAGDLSVLIAKESYQLPKGKGRPKLQRKPSLLWADT